MFSITSTTGKDPILPDTSPGFVSHPLPFPVYIYIYNILAKCPAGFHPGKNKTQRGNPRWENIPAGKSPATLSIPGRFLTSAIIVFIWLPGEKFFNPVRKS